MKLENLLHDDDAVSPVIGVILMVAITVILAAVIATFVLGLGDNLSTSSPQATFSTSYESTTTPAGTLTITHESGNSIPADELEVIGHDDGPTDWYNTDTETGESESVSAGHSATVGNVDGNTVRLVWTDPDSDTTSTLVTWSNN